MRQSRIRQGAHTTMHAWITRCVHSPLARTHSLGYFENCCRRDTPAGVILVGCFSGRLGTRLCLLPTLLSCGAAEDRSMMSPVAKQYCGGVWTHKEGFALISLSKRRDAYWFTYVHPRASPRSFDANHSPMQYLHINISTTRPFGKNKPSYASWCPASE